MASSPAYSPGSPRHRGFRDVEWTAEDAPTPVYHAGSPKPSRDQGYTRTKAKHGTPISFPKQLIPAARDMVASMDKVAISNTALASTRFGLSKEDQKDLIIQINALKMNEKHEREVESQKRKNDYTHLCDEEKSILCRLDHQSDIDIGLVKAKATEEVNLLAEGKAAAEAKLVKFKATVDSEAKDKDMKNSINFERFRSKQ
ncbi:hypothetical protein B0H63DRAFT_446071 [Podospora didyma]|uniref:Uncharacterized protein n=1 Tax=Podospora didyma TaxID=330526 RepID=A0AAE0NYJ0_9PEZI|nr:hypothetical protein B0H63DRAFT_446071 [Podospora didyma]